MSAENNAQVKGIGPAGNGQWVPPFQLVDKSGTVQFGVAVDGTLTIPGATAIDASGDLAVAGNLSVAGTSALTGNATLSGNLTMASGKKIDLSPIGAGNAALKVVATSDTPTVAFTDDGTAAHAPTTAPAGYLKIVVGSTSYYMPFWA